MDLDVSHRSADPPGGWTSGFAASGRSAGSGNGNLDCVSAKAPFQIRNAGIENGACERVNDRGERKTAVK